MGFIKILTGLLFALTTMQWPGYFYAFTLTDDAGKTITLKNNDYKFTAIRPVKTEAILRTLMCDDSTTIRLYVGGYRGLDDAHELDIMNISTKEKMVIQFPSSMSGGNEKFYRNLFAGNFHFKKGTYQIKLPQTDSAWNNLKEKHFCADFGDNDTYSDISFLQNNQQSH
jgi:hypothetical protein